MSAPAGDQGAGVTHPEQNSGPTGQHQTFSGHGPVHQGRWESICYHGYPHQGRGWAVEPEKSIFLWLLIWHSVLPQMFWVFDLPVPTLDGISGPNCRRARARSAWHKEGDFRLAASHPEAYSRPGESQKEGWFPLDTLFGQYLVSTHVVHLVTADVILSLFSHQEEALMNDLDDARKEGEENLNKARENIALLEDCLKRARQDLASLIRDHQELLNIKLAMDIEINTYRKLLEGEEQRYVSRGSIEKPKRKNNNKIPYYLNVVLVLISVSALSPEWAT